MQRQDNLTRLILASVVVLGLTPLMVCVDVQAQITFVSSRDGNPEIYVMDTDGGNQRRLTNNRHDDWSPSWSPDGKRIALVSDRDGHPDVIPGWFTSEIYVMDNDGGNQQKLTNNPSDDRDPSWSPDGKQIVFQSDRDNDRDHNIEIYVMDADGSNQQNLTNNPTADYNPSWSPDGKRIAFSSVREGHFRNNFGLTEEIYVMDADGGNQRKLTNNRHHDWYPSWSPDSKRIAFMSERDGNYEIYVMDDDGGNQKNLTNHPEDDEAPAWFNSPFSVSPTGKKFTMWGRLKQVNR